MSAVPTRRSAAEVCQHAGLSATATKLLTDQSRPEEFFDLLVDQELYDDAIRMAAHGMPKREAVWWACLCLWELYRPEPPAAVDAALHAAVRWLRDPTEPHRRLAETAGQACMDHPAGLVALAAFYSRGSITPPGLPEVAPQPQLTGKMVTTALLLALDLAPASMKPQNTKLFVTLARHRVRWDRPLQLATPGTMTPDLM